MIQSTVQPLYKAITFQNLLHAKAFRTSPGLSPVGVVENKST